MNNITKVSDITAQDIAEYLRLPDVTNDDINFINMSKRVAISYILKYTGIEKESELDTIENMVIVVFVMCQDMFDTRTLYVDKTNANKVVDSILNLYRRNLL